MKGPCLSCSQSKGRLSRQSELNRSIQSENVNNVALSLEPVDRSRDNGKRPHRITLVAWAKGQWPVWDVTCAETSAQSYFHQTSVKARADAEIVSKKIWEIH